VHKYVRFWKEGYKNKRRKRKKTQTIPDVPKIAEREQIINDRWRVGDREIDTMVCSGHQGGIVTANEKNILHNKPRKKLWYRTPHEVYHSSVLSSIT